MVRERYQSNGYLPGEEVPADSGTAARRPRPVPYHSVGFFRKAWKIVSGY